MKRTSSLACLLAVVAFSGWGCAPKTVPAPAGTATNTVPVAGQPKPADHVPTEADYRNELRTAIANFNAVKSFRAKVTIASTDGEIHSTLEFAKPNRFRGTVQSAKGDTTEIIVVDTSLYMRINNDKWLNLSKSSSAANIGTTLKNALSGDSNLASVGVDDSLPVKKSRDASAGCDLYQTTVKADANTTNNVQVCVADGRPKYLHLTTPQGQISLDYYDYNAVFLIEKPTV